ncbi:MAG: L,D-transpeptidase family protein [Arenicella sp.]|nr:L,D-transpeptidase family protein [Arenicella sp.]
MMSKLNSFIVIGFLLLQTSGIAAQSNLEPSLQASLLDHRMAELHATKANGDYELAILGIIKSIQAGELERAVEEADTHLEKFPESQVGHLLRADALSALTGQLDSVAADAYLPDIRFDGLTHQMRNRWRHQTDHAEIVHEKVPASLLDMGDHAYVIVADMSQGRLYLYQNDSGKSRLLHDYYMSVGADGYGKQVDGDNKTPVGVYAINRHIEGSALPDLYGKGAFPINYPNRYDRYLKRTGYGIWLHGTPSDTYARAPWSSEGCFVLSNDDLLDIGKYVSAEARTPVILSDAIEWLTLEQLETRKRALVGVIERWRRDWESLDTNAYISHYEDSDFNLSKGGYALWKKRKELVNEAKTFVQVDLEIKSLFAYPGVDDMFVVKYKQRYLSDNFSSESEKEQLWKLDERGRWRIIYEG